MSSAPLPILSYQPEFHTIRYTRLRVASAILLVAIGISILGVLYSLASILWPGIGLGAMRLPFSSMMSLATGALFLWCVILLAAVIPNRAGAMTSAGKLAMLLGILAVVMTVIYTATAWIVLRVIGLSAISSHLTAFRFFVTGWPLLTSFIESALLLSLIPFMRRIFARGGHSALTILSTVVLILSLLVDALYVATELFQVVELIMTPSATATLVGSSQSYWIIRFIVNALFLMLQFIFWFLILLYANDHLGHPGVPSAPAIPASN